MNVVGPPEHAVPGRAHPASTPCPRDPAHRRSARRPPRSEAAPSAARVGGPGSTGPPGRRRRAARPLLHQRARLPRLRRRRTRRRGAPRRPRVAPRPRGRLRAGAPRAHLRRGEALARDPVGQLDAVGTDDGYSLSQEVLESGDLARFLEVLVHRSVYQLKEADPHTWAIPRLGGRSGAADRDPDGRVRQRPAREGPRRAVRHDAARCRARRPYGAYLEHLPGVTLATTNLISLLGGRRRLVPALLGHLAMFENTSVGPMARWAALCDRPRLPRRCSSLLRRARRRRRPPRSPRPTARLVGGLLAECPSAAPDVVFGAAAGGLVESLFADHLRLAWAAGRSSLRDGA